MRYLLGVVVGGFLGWVLAMCRAAAKVSPKPPKRGGWVTTENELEYVEDINKFWFDRDSRWPG